jgi:hypothetical protein
VGLELRLINLGRSDVFGVSATVDVDGDLGSPIDVADVSVPNITPLSTDQVVELLEFDGILIHYDRQLLPLNLQGLLVLRRLLWVLALRLLLQPNNL